MKAYKLELLVLDFENYGPEELAMLASNARGLDPTVISIEGREIGEWSDDHPLNHSGTSKAEFARLFSPQTAPAEPMPSPSAITAWLETPDGKAAVVRAYAKLQGDIAGLNEARAVSHADLNEPMPSTASEDERTLFEAWAVKMYTERNKDTVMFSYMYDYSIKHDALVIYDGTGWQAWQARAALAKPSTIASAENSQDQQNNAAKGQE